MDIFLFHAGSSHDYRVYRRRRSSRRRNQQSKRKTSLLLHGCGSDEHPDADSTFRGKRTTNESKEHEVEKWTKMLYTGPKWEKDPVTNRETVSRVVSTLFLDLLTRHMLGNLILMATNKDHLLNQARSELILLSRNIKWNLLTIVSMSFSNKLMLKDWNYRTHNTDMSNPEESRY